MCPVVRIAVVEDDPVYTETLCSYLERYRQEHGLQFEVTAFADGMDIAENYRPVWDIILLDIEMPLLDGMSTAERIRKQDPSVVLIFITNMAQYAIQGYTVRALDYVLKPVNFYSFSMKLRSALQECGRREAFSLVVRDGENMIRLPSSEIRYVEVQAHYVTYHTERGDYTEKGTLKSLEQQLSPHGFALCNSCYLVNLRMVTGITRDQVIVCGQALQISRPKRAEFLRRLTDYMGEAGR